MPKVYALTSPSGRVIKTTVSWDIRETQRMAYDYCKARSAWAGKFWKQWDAFVRERNRRGWCVCSFELLWDEGEYAEVNDAE